MVLIVLGGVCAGGRLFYRVKSYFNYGGWHVDMLYVSVGVYLVCVYVRRYVCVDACAWMCVCVCVTLLMGP